MKKPVLLFFVLICLAYTCWAQPTVVTDVAGMTNTVVTNANVIVQNVVKDPSVTSQTTAVALAMLIIPLLVPLIVALAKFFMPKIPKVYLPIIAVVLGSVIDWISSKLGGPGVGPILGALLGAAGIGAREILDQLKQAKTASTPPNAVAAGNPTTLPPPTTP